MAKPQEKKIKVIQIRSTIGCSERVKRTMAALGLRKINQVVLHQDCPSLQGMLGKVHHLVNTTSD